jgi:hypothetical protein
LSQPIELIVLSIKERAARCRLPGTDRVISLRASRLWDIVPGAIAVVKPRKQWSYAGHPYLSGEIESARFEVAALGLVPLKLEDQKMWSPDEQYWDEKNEPSEEAERVFDRMLWLNPSDNQGVRATTLRQIVRRAPSAAHLSAASTSSPRTPLGGKHARRSSIVNSWKTIPLRPHAKWVDYSRFGISGDHPPWQTCSGSTHRSSTAERGTDRSVEDVSTPGAHGGGLC